MPNKHAVPYNADMATIIDQTLADEYGVKHTKTLNRMLQKLQSDCQRWVTPMPGCKGKSVELPFIGKNTMRRRTARDEDVVSKQTMFGNRHMYPSSFINATNFDNDDEMYNTNIDWSISAIVREDMSAIERLKDELIMGTMIDTDDSSPTHGEYIKMTALTAPQNVYEAAGGILGTNYVGKNGTQLVDLPDTDNGNDKTTNVVPYDLGVSGNTATGVGITLVKIVAAIMKLKARKALVKGVTTGVLALTPRQIAEIQLWESANNKNYGFGNLVDGIHNRILGVDILETDVLPLVKVKESPATYARVCPLFIKEHMFFGVWGNAKVRIDAQLQNKASLGHVVTTCAMGAARKFEESVIQIQCDESELTMTDVWAKAAASA